MSKFRVITFPSTHRRETELGFLRLAEAAARGQIIGAAYVAIDTTGTVTEGMFGAARIHYALTHYGLMRLAAMLLWPEDIEHVTE